MRCRAAAAGFTLVETLVALLFVAIVSVALQQGFASAQWALARAAAVKEAVNAAREILETRLSSYAPGPGTRRGVEGGLSVTVDSTPFELPFAPRSTRGGATPATLLDAGAQSQADKITWRPLLVTIRVQARVGAPVVIETVHVAGSR